ncbi:MAG: mobile mystery protein B [Candidatus Aureabacteria bacterium]|nr:mobile mystery protein B [Candidatus Auribacterota bacterium]
MKFEYPDGATPIDSDETAGLLLPHISTKAELDRWEQDNINEADMWAEKYRRKDIITITFIRRLHKEMFKNVWQWAGKFRKSDKNIGVPWHQITQNLRALCDDTNYWINNSTYKTDEVAWRFHYRLVFIHPFPNGNGRHSRLMADLILIKIYNKSRFTWGSENLAKPSECRKRYIEALRSADRNDFSFLKDFVRS